MLLPKMIAQNSKEYIHKRVLWIEELRSVATYDGVARPMEMILTPKRRERFPNILKIIMMMMIKEDGQVCAQDSIFNRHRFY